MQITLVMSGYGLVPFSYADALNVFQVIRSTLLHCHVPAVHCLHAACFDCCENSTAQTAYAS